MTGSQLKELWDVRMLTDLMVFLSTCQDHDRPRKEDRAQATICLHPHSVTMQGGGGTNDSWVRVSL